MNDDFRVGDWLVQPSLGRISKDGRAVHVRAKVMDLLVYLAARQGDVISKDALLNGVWGTDAVSESALTRTIAELRQAFEDNVDNPELLDTIPKRGYRLIAPVFWPAPGTGFGSEAGSASSEDAGAPLGYPRAFWWGAILVGLAVVAALVVSRPSPGPVGSSTPGWRIAVLPLQNLSRDEHQAPIADGLTEALTTELAQIETIEVVARESAMQYKGSQRTSAEIAAALRVDALIRGSVMLGNENVRIAIQLVDPATDRLLWANSYHRPSRDVVMLLGEISATIARELNIELSAELKARLARPRPVVPAAYVAYQKGRFHWNRLTEEGYRDSVRYFEQAIALDRGYAAAHAALARSYNSLRQVHGPREFLPRMRAEIQTALSLDPMLAEAHSLQAITAAQQFDFTGAEASHHAALKLGPNDVLALVHYAGFLNQTDRHDEALTVIRRAERLDPLSPYVGANVIPRLNALARYEEALEQAATVRELRPGFWLTQQWLGGTYWRMGRVDDAILAWEQGLRLPGNYDPWTLSRLVGAYFAAGRRQDAAQALARLEGLAATRYVEPVVLAGAYAAMHRRAQAVAVIEKAFCERDLEPWRLKGLQGQLGAEPRFRTVLQALGTAQPTLGPRPACESRSASH